MTCHSLARNRGLRVQVYESYFRLLRKQHYVPGWSSHVAWFTSHTISHSLRSHLTTVFPGGDKGGNWRLGGLQSFTGHQRHTTTVSSVHCCFTPLLISISSISITECAVSSFHQQCQVYIMHQHNPRLGV